MHGLIRLRLGVMVLMALVSAGALAQAPGARALRELDPELESPEAAEPPVRAETALPKPAARPPVAPAASKKALVPKIEAAEPKLPAARLPPLLSGTANDAALEAAWRDLQKAIGGKDLKALGVAKARLLRLKGALGATNLEAYSVALARASKAREEAGDAAETVELALAAVELAPDLPQAHMALAKAYFFADVSELDRYLSALRATAHATLKDPRYSRALATQAGSAALIALAATAALVVILLFLRRARYFFHDFHHFFPKAASRWQTATLALVLLSLPWILKLGMAWGLVALLAASALYLTMAERLVSAMLVAVLGLLPLLAGQLVHRTAFAGTTAEQLNRLEQGGPGNAELSAAVARRAGAEKAGYHELFALGRYELRRGQLDAAVTHLKAALAERTQEPRALVNLANAMFAKGDLEGPVALYEEASKDWGTRAVAFHNLAKLRARRAAASSSDEVRAIELDKIQDALSAAEAVDPSLATRPEPPAEDLQVNLLLVSPGLSRAEVAELAVDPERGEQVRLLLTRTLLGGWGGPLSPLWARLAAALCVGIGGLQRSRRVAGGCQKCGRAVCRRCDGELPAGGALCAQCVNVFTRSGVAAAALTVQKQIEVARYQDRKSKLRYLLGVLLAGGGHLLLGLPVRAAGYLFVFLFGGALLLLHEGVVRAPHEGVPAFVLFAPIALVIGLVYLFSLLALRKRQGG